MVKQVITDEELTLKRQARRRLVGAIVLTIMVVILLPMLLDKDPAAPAQDIELNIPDKDKVGEFDPKMALPPLAANSAVVQSAVAPATTQVVLDKPVIAPLLDSKPAPAIVQPKVEAKPVAEVKPKVIAKPVVKESVTPVAKKHAGFVVQVGAFTHADAAKKLQEKLSKEGYPSYTEKTGNKTRVRIGDYATQAEADKVRQKLEIQGVKPDVLNLK